MARNKRIFWMKKGQAGQESLMIIPKIILTGVIILTFIFIVSKFLDKNIDSFPVEYDIFVQRLLYSNSGISYYDPVSGNIEAGIIDLDKISNANFESTLMNGIDYSYPLSAKIVISSPSKSNTEIKYHKSELDFAMVLVKAKLKDSGFYYMKKSYPILIHSDSMQGLERGVLTVEVALPKSYSK